MNNLIVEVHRKKEIDLYKQSKSLPGPYFVLPFKWLNTWLKYLKGAAKPSRIILNPLLDSKKIPKPNLSLKKDYITIPKKLWDYLKATYGCDYQIECSKTSIYEKENSIISSRTTSPSSSQKEPIRCIRIQKNKSIEDISKKSEARNSSYRPRLISEFKPISFQSTPRATSGLVSLENNGSVCFMNTTLQCILALNNLTKIIMKLKRDAPLLNILKEFYLQARSGVCDNKPFTEFFKADFPPGRQHDMPEFLRKFLETLDKELYKPKHVQECDPWREYKSQHSKLIVNVFSGLACSKIICVNCGDKREQYEPFTSLTLQVTTSLTKSIEKYLEKEVISDEYFCNACERVVTIEKQYFLIKCPNILIIQLKRFVTIPFSRKVNMQCQFPFELELTGNEKNKYDLKAVAVHSGNVNSGHYSAFCKRNSKWFMFDDSTFQEVELSQVKEIQAYLFMFSKKIL